MTAQAIASFAPGGSEPHFIKIECFCFKQQTLEGRRVAALAGDLLVDHKLSKDNPHHHLVVHLLRGGRHDAAGPRGAGA
jgi:cytochrome c oxidase assembly protein Cox11